MTGGRGCSSEQQAREPAPRWPAEHASQEVEQAAHEPGRTPDAFGDPLAVRDRLIEALRLGLVGPWTGHKLAVRRRIFLGAGVDASVAAPMRTST